MQEIRERSRRKEAAELRLAVVKWEVEVSLLQINLCSERAAGSFLLAAQKAQLGGCVLPSTNRNVLSVEMQARRLPPLQILCPTLSSNTCDSPKASPQPEAVAGCNAVEHHSLIHPLFSLLSGTCQNHYCQPCCWLPNL